MSTGARNPPVSGCGEGDYSEQLRRIQAHLRDSEAKRVNLERKLLEHRTSDPCITKLKYKKLKKYLNEICERQKKSQLRNQDLLKEFDCIEGHIRKFALSSESLQKLKAEYEKEIRNRLTFERKDILKNEMRDVANHKIIPEASQLGINSSTATSKGLYHTATIFMGRQMSAASSVEDSSALQKSKITKSFSISDPHSCRQPSQSCYMIDSCVVQTNNDLQCSNKTDKIDGMTSLLKGGETQVTSNVSYKNETAYENERTCFLTVGSMTNHDSNNTVENKICPELNTLLNRRVSLENRSSCYSSCKSLEKMTPQHAELNEQETKEPVSLLCHPEQIVSEKECPREKFSVFGNTLQLNKNSLQEDDNSLEDSSDLTVSLSEEEEEESNLLKLQPNLNSVDYNPDSTAYNKKEYSHSQTYIADGASSSSFKLRECLSFEGFSHALTFIEELVARSSPEYLTLYHEETVSRAELENILSLCNKTGNLTQENLQGCEALVRYQLQQLLQNTMNGCLLQDKKLNDRKEQLNEEQDRSELTSYFAMTWERLSKHILFLQMHHVSLTQEVKDMFGTLLIMEKHKQEELTTPLLKDSFVEDCEDKSISCSDKTSHNSQAKKSQNKTGLNMDNNGLKEHKIKESSSETSLSSLEKESSLLRDENQRKKISTIQSKAFWGDSDDSNSDIEAALRPQGYCLHEDEFSDFYD